MYIRRSEYLNKYLTAGSLTVTIYAWLNYGTDSVNNKFDCTQVQAINAAYANYNTYYSMICLLKLPNSYNKKYKRCNLNHLLSPPKMSFHLLPYFCEYKSKFKQIMLSSVTDWARKICQQTTLTITAILISYWYLTTTLTKVIKEKTSRLGAFAKPVWSHNDVFWTV